MGAASILRERRPDLLLEIEPAHLGRLGTSAKAVADLLVQLGYSFFRTGSTASGAPLLSPEADISSPSKQPNVFATVDVNRALRRGVSLG